MNFVEVHLIKRKMMPKQSSTSNTSNTISTTKSNKRSKKKKISIAVFNATTVDDVATNCNTKEIERDDVKDNESSIIISETGEELAISPEARPVQNRFAAPTNTHSNNKVWNKYNNNSLSSSSSSSLSSSSPSITQVHENSSLQEIPLFKIKTAEKIISTQYDHGYIKVCLKRSFSRDRVFFKELMPAEEYCTLEKRLRELINIIRCIPSRAAHTANDFNIQSEFAMLCARLLKSGFLFVRPSDAVIVLYYVNHVSRYCPIRKILYHVKGVHSVEFEDSYNIDIRQTIESYLIFGKTCNKNTFPPPLSSSSSLPISTNSSINDKKQEYVQPIQQSNHFLQSSYLQQLQPHYFPHQFQHQKIDQIPQKNNNSNLVPDTPFIHPTHLTYSPLTFPFSFPLNFPDLNIAYAEYLQHQQGSNHNYNPEESSLQSPQQVISQETNNANGDYQHHIDQYPKFELSSNSVQVDNKQFQDGFKPGQLMSAAWPSKLPIIV